MASVPRERRTARFRCLIAIVCPRRSRETTVEGVVEGVLLEGPRGTGGFGYDPVFFLPAARARLRRALQRGEEPRQPPRPGDRPGREWLLAAS